MLIFELPALLLVLRWYWRGSAAAPAVLAGVLAFFSYYYVSQVFGIAQNRLFRFIWQLQALPDSRWSSPPPG